MAPGRRNVSNVNGSKWISKTARHAIYARDGHACVYCGKEDKLSLDHLIPRELGGGHEATNLVTACVHCNSARRDLSIRSWLQVLRDQGVDTDGLAAKIRRHAARRLDLKAAREMLKNRK